MPEATSTEKPTFGQLRQKVQTRISDKESQIQKFGGDPEKTPKRFLIKEAAKDVRQEFKDIEQKKEQIKQEEEIARLEKLASKDPLTGLLSRAEYERRQEEERARAVRNNYPMVIASLDLNKLKETNDNLGHAKGDEYLKKTGEIIKGSIRLEDIAGRIGGDEFMVLFVETDLDQANIWLERIRKEFETKGIDISIGLSAVDLTADIKRSIEIAEKRMYKNKREQKNGNHKPSIIEKLTTKLRKFFGK